MCALGGLWLDNMEKPTDPNPLISYSVWPCCNPSFLQALCQARAGSHQHPQASAKPAEAGEQRSVGADSRAAQGSQLHLTEPRNTTTLACGLVLDVTSLPVTEPQQHSVRVDLSPSRWRPRPPSAQWRRKWQLITDPPSAPSVWNAKCISALARNENNCGRQKEIISIAKCYI